MRKNYEKVLKWFQSLLKDEINEGNNFYKDNLLYILDAKKKKLIYDSYGYKIGNAMENISKLPKDNQEDIEIVMQHYTSEAFRYFFRRLEEGEASGDIGRINFELKAINDTTGEETLLISADENDDIDNDFQGWILDNCSGLEEDKEN